MSGNESSGCFDRLGEPSMNVDRSVKRWTGWSLILYGLTWSYVWIEAAGWGGPAAPTLENVAGFVVFFIVLTFLFHFGFEFLFDTGGLVVRHEGDQR